MKKRGLATAAAFLLPSAILAIGRLIGDLSVLIVASSLLLATITYIHPRWDRKT